MHRDTAKFTVKVIWQELSKYGSAASHELSRVKEILDMLSDESTSMSGHEAKALLDEATVLLRHFQHNNHT